MTRAERDADRKRLAAELRVAWLRQAERLRQAGDERGAKRCEAEAEDVRRKGAA